MSRCETPVPEQDHVGHGLYKDGESDKLENYFNY